MLEIAETMELARGVRATEPITIRKPNCRQLKGNVTMNTMNVFDKSLLAPAEISRGELKAMVDEWVEAGGVITECAPGVALNFRTAEVPHVARPKAIQRLIKARKTAGVKPKPKSKSTKLKSKKAKKK